MGETKNISWATSTFSPWWGCTKISPGCDNCYAESFDKRWGDSHWGKGVPRRVFGDKHWNEPLKWNRLAGESGEPWRVFCASMADVMDDEAPEGQRERLWDLIDNTPHLTWQLLTKRPHRYSRYLPQWFKHGNVWLGTTAENQEFYDIRWPILREVAHQYNAVSWISYEPAIGTLVMRPKVNPTGHYYVPDWIICGGESGSNRRPMEQKWAEDLKAECEITGTKFFMKQFSALRPDQGKALIPAHLLVHEFPA
jgi:protein gp37